MANAEPHTAVGADGSWRLGIARSRHAKRTAEYLGAEVRAGSTAGRSRNSNRGLDEVQGEVAEHWFGLAVSANAVTRSATLSADHIRHLG
ncbi:hypothetical protein ACWCP8_05620 [Streptomyces sp. NPDC002206]